jgi:hypothetical protein
MYGNCMFCGAPLGANRVIEHQSIGSALAFDSAKGRLWVICPRCVGWNLVPIEERWEAVEECEALFAGVPRHFSSDNIGLGVAGDGSRLIRVGEPTPREFAAWRYEPRLRRRRRINQVRSVIASSAVAGVAAFWGTLAAVGASVVAGAYGVIVLGFWVAGDRDVIFARVPAKDATYPVMRGDESHIRLARRGDRRCVVLNDRGADDAVFDEDVTLALGLVLPYVNRKGGKAEEVDAAVKAIHEAGGAEAWLDRMCDSGSRVRALPVHARLALEMAAHELMEATALRGELRGLELAWKAAEELASISDRLLTPLRAIARMSRRDLTPMGRPGDGS